MIIGKSQGKILELKDDGEYLSSDGGIILTKKKVSSMSQALAKVFEDKRDKSKVKHSIEDMLSQRIFGIIAGNEDINDHNQIRNDEIYKMMIDKDDDLASASTLCRMEKVSGTRDISIAAHNIMFNDFINSYDEAPKDIIIDFDPTDTTLYGDQEGKYYHGYYKSNCYLPLIATCNNHLLCAYLRQSDKDPARHIWAILSILVKNIRKVWPDVKITFRADSGLCRHKILNWCERSDIKYIVGIPTNNTLKRMTSELEKEVLDKFNNSDKTKLIKDYTEITYGAETWIRERKIIVKNEQSSKGSNTRLVVTNIDGNAKDLYENIYCLRGDMENRIKEYQTDMFGSRCSCSLYDSNQYRMILSALAYTAMLDIKSFVKDKTGVAPYCSTLRSKFIKVAVIIRKKKTKIQLVISKSYTNILMFMQMAKLFYNSA